VKIFCVVLLVVVACASLPVVVSAQQGGKYEVAGVSDERAAEKFFRDLQEAVAKDERARVASMFDYPVYVRGRRTLRLKRRADLLRRYDAVFNGKVKRALAAQKASELFVNYQGIMIGDGEIWFGQNAKNNKLGIIAINN
jgi:hypothetical protein